MSKLRVFWNYIEKECGGTILKQAPPGPPPRPGLVWKPSTHRWINPENKYEYTAEGGETSPELDAESHETKTSISRKKLFNMDNEIQHIIDLVESSHHPEIIKDLIDFRKIGRDISRKLFDAREP